MASGPESMMYLIVIIVGAGFLLYAKTKENKAKNNLMRKLGVHSDEELGLVREEYLKEKAKRLARKDMEDED